MTLDFEYILACDRCGVEFRSLDSTILDEAIEKGWRFKERDLCPYCVKATWAIGVER